MRKVIFATVASLIAVVAIPFPAKAVTDMPRSCVVANSVCFVLRTAAGGFDPEQRMDRVNERLASILGYENLRPGNIRMARLDNSTMAIYVGPSLLVTVTGADAQANHLRSPEALGQIWLRNLQIALPGARPLSR